MGKLGSFTFKTAPQYKPHYERQEAPGDPWLPCFKSDVERALRSKGTRMVDSGETVPSQWGVLYRKRQPPLEQADPKVRQRGGGCAR